MKDSNERPYDALERLFHEPNRLAIVSSLCAANSGMTFNQLKLECGLTDGNLNRHLNVLEQAGAVRIAKSFVRSKPQTTVFLSRRGLDDFSQYVNALGQVLEKARQAIPKEKRASLPFLSRPIEA